MSQKKPVMGRGLEALLGQMTRRSEPGAPAQPNAPAQGAEAPSEQHFPVTNSRICRSICCSVASTSRASTCARSRCRNWPIRSRRRASCSPSSCGRSTAPRRVHRSATKSSPANAAGAPRRSPGLATVPAVIRRVPDEAAIAMSLIENIQRENLNPLEEARALERLISEFGITHQQAADAVGRSRAAVSNLLRLLELRAGGQALRRATRARDGPCARAAVAHAAPPAGRSRHAGREEGPVGARNRGAGAQHARAAPPAAANRRKPGPSIRTCSACRTICRRNSAPWCRFSTATSGKGKVVVSYHSLDELDGILAHIR